MSDKKMIWKSETHPGQEVYRYYGYSEEGDVCICGHIPDVCRALALEVERLQQHLATVQEMLIRANASLEQKDKVLTATR